MEVTLASFIVNKAHRWLPPSRELRASGWQSTATRRRRLLHGGSGTFGWRSTARLVLATSAHRQYGGTTPLDTSLPRPPDRRAFARTDSAPSFRGGFHPMAEAGG